jgi:hypothetical protein
LCKSFEVFIEVENYYVALLMFYQLKAHESMLMLKLEPFAVQLRKVLDMLQALDAANIFSIPVSAKDVSIFFLDLLQCF